MKDALDLRSKSGIHRLITALEERGFIRRLPNRARAIEVIKLPESVAHGIGSGMGAARARGFTPSVIEGNLGRVRTASEDDGGRPVAVPVMGRIAAGRPVEALENPESISLADFTGSKDVYVLQVTGESMQDEHIVNGDYVLVEKTNIARDGEIVVALVSGSDATLKRIYTEGNKIRLQPSNTAMQPIIVPAAEVQIQGRVIGVLRKY